MAGKKFTFAQEACIRKAGLALRRANALWPGCRIGIAVSGGADSFVLLKTMRIRQGIVPFPFEIMALHCNAGFDITDHATLAPWLAREGVPFHIEVDDFGPMAHSEENRKKSPCFLCAWHRRKRLFRLCQQYHLTHLALGHNADDLLATFMLNFCRNGRMASLGIDEPFFDGGLHLIRPLLLVEKKHILQAARQWRLPIWPNTCPSSGKTRRDQTGEIVTAISGFIPMARTSMLNAITRQTLAAHNQAPDLNRAGGQTQKGSDRQA